MYALDTEQILWVYKEGISPLSIERRSTFSDMLLQHAPGFEVPQRLKVVESKGRIYTVERHHVCAELRCAAAAGERRPRPTWTLPGR